MAELSPGSWRYYEPYVNEADARAISIMPAMVAKLIELHAFIVDQYGESEATEELAALISKVKGEAP